MSIVKSPNEVDFIAIVTFAPADPDHAILYPFGGRELGRVVKMELVAEQLKLKCAAFALEPYCAFVIEPKAHQVYAWYPLWSSRHQGDAMWAGTHLLFVSATPVGVELFNASIQLDGPMLRELARKILRPDHD